MYKMTNKTIIKTFSYLLESLEYAITKKNLEPVDSYNRLLTKLS